MSETKRLSDRNKLIQELLTDGKGLMNFYRFVAQNPHINLHDACQIVINRPNASVCFLFSEWNEMERRIIKGRKGIPYYDENGNKRFAFDKNDTWGKEYMIWVFLATAGVWSIAMGVAMIIAHKNEDKAKAKKMLVNYGIGLIVIFAILVAVPYLVRGIAFLVS